MKTLRTDDLGAYPWSLLGLAVCMAWFAFSEFESGDGSSFGIFLGGAITFLLLASKKFWDVGQSRNKGGDHSKISGVSND